MKPDIVYFVRNDQPLDGKELRYSLRSLVNLPHNRVFIIGGKAKWIENVIHVPFRDSSNKWINIMRRWALLGEMTEPSNTIYRMCDDDYILNPVVGLQKKYHTNSVQERYDNLIKIGGRGLYTQGFGNTLPILKEMGFERPMNHKIHLPLIVNRDCIPSDLLTQHANKNHVIHGPLLAGNRSPQPPVKLKKDWKARTPEQLQECLDMNQGFLSSNEATFKPSGIYAYLKAKFPDKSPYER